LWFTTTAFAVKDLQGTILDVNPAFCALMGYSREELVGQNHRLITHPDDVVRTDEVLQRMASGELREHIWNKRYVTKSGRTLVCRKKLAVFGPSLAEGLLILQVEDISLEIQLREERQLAQERLQGALDGIPGLVALWGPDLRNIVANRAYIDFFGKTPEQIRGMHLKDLLGPALWKQNEPFLNRALAGESVSFERSIPTPTGVRHSHAAYLPVLKDGTLEGIYVFVTDRSELKDAQLNLKTILDSATDLGILSFDTEGRIWVFSRGCALLLGHSQETILGTTGLPQFFDADELRARELELADRSGHGPRGFQVFTFHPKQGPSERKTWTMVRRDGTRFPASVVVSPILTQDNECTGFLMVLRDITTELDSRAKLFDAMERAEVANLAKSQFLANMSHEIRTPLNGVLGIAQVLAETNLSALQSEYLEMIQVSGQSLLQILNDVLDFSKMEAGRMEIQEVAFQPKLIVRTLSSLFDLKAKEKGLVFKMQVEGTLPESLVGDPLRIQQILVNLVGNAVKFTTKGHVTLTLTLPAGSDPAHPRLCAVIEDTGIGMTQDQLAKLFQPFVQAEASTAQRFGGTGLGLTISKHLVELMGGDLEVTSHPGFGSVFRVSIPVEIATTALATPVAEPSIPIPGIRILLVEDGPINQVVAKALLEKAGALVSVQSNGRAAVEAVRRAPGDYDLILMDVQMPEMNGIDATRMLRRELKVTIPIIALTAGAMADERIACLEAGMDDFLAKPFQRTEILATVAKYHRTSSKAGATAQGEQPVSVSELEEVLDFDHELFVEIMQMFQESLPDRIQKLTSAWESGDSATLGQLLHSLMGTSGSVGARRISQACVEVQTSVTQDDREKTSEKLQELFHQMREFLKALDLYFNTASSREPRKTLPQTPETLALPLESDEVTPKRPGETP